MELSITVQAPREGGDSRPFDRFAFEGLLFRARVCLCVCVCLQPVLCCVCLRWRGRHKDRAIKR